MELTLRDEVTSHYPLTLEQHQEASYVPRTVENAYRSQLTVALAVDYQTAGERCTIRAAGSKYVAVPFTWHPERAAGHICKWMFDKDATKLNIAGNGIYTMARYGYDQERINQKVYDILKIVHRRRPIEHVRSGGQTGVDTAGLVAAMALNIPCLGLFPKGFRQRFDHDDILRDRDELYAELVGYAQKINLDKEVE